MIDLRDELFGFAYRTGWATIGRLPEGAATRMFAAVADRVFARRGPSVVQLARNLRRVLGPAATPEALGAVTKAGLRSYARYWLETFRLERMDLAEVAERALAGTYDYQQTIAAREAGRGVVIALPHSGNWDIGGLSMARLHGSISTVAERLRPESVYRRFVAYRESLGFEVLPLTGGSAPASQVLRERLKQGRMICLLADRDLGPGGVPVTFFGERTTMPAGPAMLAALTGADLCPTHAAYTDTGWIQNIGPPLKVPGTRLAEQVRNGTQMLADAFAERIALFPADWHMLQPLWTADLAPAAATAVPSVPR